MNPSDPHGQPAVPQFPDSPPTPAPGAELPTAPAPTTLASEEAEALFTQIYRLQTALAATLVALLFLSLGLILFMGKQMTSVRTRLHADRQNAQQVFTDFQNDLSPKIRSFVRSLQLFAVTNNDLTPILEKYRPVLEAYYLPAVPTPMSGSVSRAAKTNAPPTNAPTAQPK